MRIKVYRIIIICGLLLYACSNEPEDPKAIELLTGSFQTPWIELIQGNKLVKIEVNDSSGLRLNSNFTYSLFIKATIPNSDSTIRILQNGTFEIPQSKYDKGVEQTIPFETLNGKIMFYPENKNSWGGNFSFSNEMFNILNEINLDGINIGYFLWFKDSE